MEGLHSLQVASHPQTEDWFYKVSNKVESVIGSMCFGGFILSLISFYCSFSLSLKSEHIKKFMSVSYFAGLWSMKVNRSWLTQDQFMTRRLLEEG